MNLDSGPAGANVFSAALQWVQATLLGTLGTSVAVIAVASIGFLLLSGRIDVRRSLQMILGCFILCGASAIAAGIVSAARDTDVHPSVAPPPPAANVAPSPQGGGKAVPYDPYAGAALPTRP